MKTIYEQYDQHFDAAAGVRRQFWRLISGQSGWDVDLVATILNVRQAPIEFEYPLEVARSSVEIAVIG